MVATFRNVNGIRWVAVLVWMAMIFTLSAQSHLPDLTPGLPGVEEIGGHLTAYSVLAGLLWWALRGARVQYPATWALVVAVLYGASDELHQYFVPGRTMTVSDLIVDLLGATLALLVLNWAYLRYRSPRPRR